MAIRSASSTALQLWIVLSRAFAAVEARVKADVARHGLTPAEFGVLEVLYHKGPMLLSEVKRKILVSSGGITYLVDRLEAKGLAERRSSPEDRRASFAALTEDGEALMRRVFPEHATMLEDALSGLTGEEQAQAAALLRRLGRRAAGMD